MNGPIDLQDYFDDVSEWVKAHPGDRHFCCEFCGIYDASAPQCNKCEEIKEE